MPLNVLGLLGRLKQPQGDQTGTVLDCTLNGEGAPRVALGRARQGQAAARALGALRKFSFFAAVFWRIISNGNNAVRLSC
jgi:hypothetical protein